ERIPPSFRSGAGGRTRVWLLDPRDLPRGAFWTPNISACPNDAVESSLSHILETGAHLRKYCLSPKAAAGILRRAERRGKRLPEPLAAALAAVAGRQTPTG